MARRHLTFDGLETRNLMSGSAAHAKDLAPIWVMKPEMMGQIVDRIPYEIETIGLANPDLPKTPPGLLNIKVS